MARLRARLITNFLYSFNKTLYKMTTHVRSYIVYNLKRRNIPEQEQNISLKSEKTLRWFKRSSGRLVEVKPEKLYFNLN